MDAWLFICLMPELECEPLRQEDQDLLALNFLARVFQEAPDKDFLLELASLAQEFSKWPRLDCNAPQLYTETNLEACVKELAAEHLRLFSGPSPLVPFWESVWLEREKLLFGERTDQVYATYADWGIAISNAGHDPEDHLGLELAFLAYLLGLKQTDPNAHSASGVPIDAAIKEFLTVHLLAFAPQALELAQSHAQTDFYKASCAHCLALLENLRCDYA